VTNPTIRQRAGNLGNSRRERRFAILPRLYALTSKQQPKVARKFHVARLASAKFR